MPRKKDETLVLKETKDESLKIEPKTIDTTEKKEVVVEIKPLIKAKEEKVETKKITEVKKEEIIVKKEEEKKVPVEAVKATPVQTAPVVQNIQTQPQVQTQPQQQQQQAPSRVVYTNNNHPNNRVHVQMQRPQMQQQHPQMQRPQAPVEPIITETIKGVLEIMPDGQGFVRPKFIPHFKDAFLASMQIRRYGLRAGDLILGQAKAPKDGEKYWAITRIDKVNDMELSAALNRPDFKDLVPIYAEKQIKLETDAQLLSTRILDLFCPIGFGQRGMVVSPPKAGKTTLLKEIAAGVAINYPEVHLMAVLVGERPEEVTDMQRFIKGEVIASSFDQKPEEQTRSAEIAMERAKRLVELGKDVVIVFDSITRLARAYNLAIPTSGRTLSGGFDPAALYPSKRFFGAARNIEGGGSLTIIGTSLVDTGSKMDDLIFEEFKGTGNMELRLERRLAERRIFPAFDILRSGTRREDLLLAPEILNKIIAIRRMFDTIDDKDEATTMIIGQMNRTKNNVEFLSKVGK